MHQIEIHSLEYSGKTVAQKLTMIVDDLEQKNIQNLFITRLDSIAWLLNIRGKDVPNSPVVFAYFKFAKRDGVWKYTVYPRDVDKFDSAVQNHICADTLACVEVSPHYSFISNEVHDFVGTVLLPGTGTTYGIDAAVDETPAVINAGNCPVE